MYFILLLDFLNAERILRSFLRPWLIGIQSAGAAMRGSEPEMSFAKQPRVHLALKCFEFSMHRLRKKEDACHRQKAWWALLIS
jgi:hypothetical protein